MLDYLLPVPALLTSSCRNSRLGMERTPHPIPKAKTGSYRMTAVSVCGGLMNVFGIDIGGSGIKGAPVDTQSGELVEERVRIKTPKPATPEAIVGTAVEGGREAGRGGPRGRG